MKTILIDLDGVLNEYNGNYDKNIIPKPRQGVKNFLIDLSISYKLILFTTRNKDLVAKWLQENNLNQYFSHITNKKEPAWLIIDDRCIKFEGNYISLIKQIHKFKPWYK